MTKYSHERGMGSRSHHGTKVSRRDTRSEIKTEARSGRGNNKIAVRKEAFGK